ncbi:hypothetical protein SAMN06265365_104107 [Tistlia consotensis]|uniref:Uncharacterized protein n=1 Tax=Tistlia consotensis USBA 355 TaxID=560819 RepID=A0A1Y6BS43_9PROT|nr:hypothetical protein [Tistlia consotensis]SMF22477.1 hypothetical protein SAMN05428998_107187 [Tistlia consotensis USBA 355]SNR45906.1 hypothetical protein SAMN06265365_104107 [Tistlia consotensis]
MTGTTAAHGLAWLAALRRYLAALLLLNLLWETAQMPLYTVWYSGTPGEIAFDVLHCSLGDLLIATACLVLALGLVGSAGWPARRFGVVLAAATAAGVGYTVYSEWLNVSLRGSWAYAEAMPLLPPLGTGLAPLLQWLLVPPLALAWAAGRLPGRDNRSGGP